MGKLKVLGAEISYYQQNEYDYTSCGLVCKPLNVSFGRIFPRARKRLKPGSVSRALGKFLPG
jgi:hypothetical protein